MTLALSCRLNTDDYNKKHAITITIEEPDNENTAIQSRSAIPELPNDSLKYKLIATKGQTTIITASSIEGNPNKFLLEITEGFWTVSVYGFNDNLQISEMEENAAIFYGQKRIYVTDNGEYAETIPVYYIQNGNGIVQLSINVEATNISKLTIGGTESILDQDYYRNEDGFITIEATNVPANTYNAVLTFYENINTEDSPEFIKVISIQEKVNVRQNLTTNKWVKAGNTLYLQTTNGIYGDFVLNNDIITAITNSSFYVSSNNLEENKLDNFGHSASDSNSGSWADPFASIQGAVNRISVLAATNNNQIPYTIYIDGPLTNQTCNITNDMAEQLNLTIRPYKTESGETSASIEGSTENPIFCLYNNVCLELIDLQMDNNDIEVSPSSNLIFAGNSKLSNGSIKLFGDAILQIKEIHGDDNVIPDVIAKIITETPVENKVLIESVGDAILSENVLQHFRLNNPGYYLSYSENKTGIVKASSISVKLPEFVNPEVKITVTKKDGTEIQATNDCYIIHQDLLAKPQITAENTTFQLQVKNPQEMQDSSLEYISWENLKLTLYLENTPIVTENSSLPDDNAKILSLPENFCFPGKYVLQAEYCFEGMNYDSNYLIQIL